MDGPSASRARCGDRLHRPSEELAVSRRTRAALRAGQGLPARQAARGCRYHRHGAAHLPGKHRLRTLADWLEFIERQHPKTIALGLDRVSAVHRRMRTELACPVITVAGTNGKGSCCALLEAMLRAGGYRTALYASPHLERYNERVRIAGVEASDDALCASFQAVEDARGQVALTYFEYGTLAALWL